MKKMKNNIKKDNLNVLARSCKDFQY